MTVHHIINYFGVGRGGAELLVQQLHYDLIQQGIDSRLMALEACRTEGVPNAASLNYSSPYDVRALGSLLRYARNWVKAGDLVHAHLFPSSAYVSALRQTGLIKCRCVFTEHSTFNRRRHGWFGRTIDRAVYRGFDKICTISNGVNRALLEAYPNLQNRSEVILNGANLLFSDPIARDGTAKRTPIILSVGRLTKVKNYRNVLEALSRFEGESFKYIILGEGSERQAIQECIKSFGLSKKVVLKGNVSNIRPYLERADIFLIASRWEGFGLAAVEAMNASLPVVASNVPGLREVTGENGECAVLVAPDCPGSIADAIRALLVDPERRAALGSAGFERAKSFDKSRMTADYIAAYKGLVGTGIYGQQ